MPIHITTKLLLKELTKAIKEKEDQPDEPDKTDQTDQRKSGGGRRLGDIKRKDVSGKRSVYR